MKISIIFPIIATLLYANSSSASMTGQAAVCPISIIETDLILLAKNPETGISVGGTQLIFAVSGDKLSEAQKALDDALNAWKSISPIHREKIATLKGQEKSLCTYQYVNSGAVYNTTHVFTLKTLNAVEYELYKKRGVN